MKRSKSVKLAVMGLSPLIFQACTEPKTDALIYPSVGQCIEDGKLTPQQCTSEYQKAVKEHQEKAPKYKYLSECETNFGLDNCKYVSTRSGAINYVPIMTAFMAPLLYRSLAPGYSQTVYSQPLYRSSYGRGSYTTLDHYTIPRKIGEVKAPRKATNKPSLKTRTVSRGGFGSRAAARGIWGSRSRGGRSWGG